MPVINMRKTGQNIEKLMIEKEISKKQLQNIFGFGTVGTIYSWCSGNKLPSIDNLVWLAEIFGTTIDKILVVE